MMVGPRTATHEIKTQYVLKSPIEPSLELSGFFNYGKDSSMNSAVDRDVESLDIEICRKTDDSLYLIAIKGSAVVPNRIPFTEEQMQSMFVQMGNHSDESTMWSPSCGRERAAESNYDYLIGYRSLEAQEAGFQKLLIEFNKSIVIC